MVASRKEKYIVAYIEKRTEKVIGLFPELITFSSQKQNVAYLNKNRLKLKDDLLVNLSPKGSPDKFKNTLKLDTIDKEVEYPSVAELTETFGEGIIHDGEQPIQVRSPEEKTFLQSIRVGITKKLTPSNEMQAVSPANTVKTTTPANKYLTPKSVVSAKNTRVSVGSVECVTPRRRFTFGGVKHSTTTPPQQSQ